MSSLYVKLLIFILEYFWMDNALSVGKYILKMLFYFYIIIFRNFQCRENIWAFLWLFILMSQAVNVLVS